MKNRYILPTLAFCFLSFTGFAQQIMNAGFEDLDTTGMIRNWTNTTLIPISIDSAGNSDSLVFDQAFYFSTTDAHAGQFAMEMRNAYNFTTGIGYAGSAQASTNDTQYAFFEIFLPTMGATIADFSFYCKYFPVGTESAMASMNVLDSSGSLMGNATAVINGTMANYGYISAPVNYTAPGPTAFMTISFRTCLPTDNPVLGTRFLVDDLSFAISITGVQEISNAKQPTMSCFPTVVSDNLNLSFNDLRGNEAMQIQILDASGRIVRSEKLIVSPGKAVSIDATSLTAGSYFVKAVNDKLQLTGRFIK
jgi:hypothetical protein